MDRYLCIHAHFYQPPRENPWLEAIEQQDSAYPYHDWNERITEQCYHRNANAHILDGKGYVTAIVNNYSKISFNFGPTLLSWIAAKTPDLYQLILKADADSQKTFGGHGNAMAQAYNHMIMPLANDRDKYTQIAWGIRDFEFHFKRKPEGLWLAETAVDLATLDIMATLGIQFTILSPSQAKQTRPLNTEQWQDVSGGKISPLKPYLQKLPSGRSIVLFFYDGPVSQSIAFSDTLKNGENLAKHLMEIFSNPDESIHASLAHIATDGETYGHHHEFGEMALAYALQHIENNHLATLTNYGQYLTLTSPIDEVDIFECSSWSCVHGVERWKSNCGCNSGNSPEFHQEWRAPLRAALDWLRDLITPLYETKAKEFLQDPWGARNQYIEVLLDHSPDSLQRFFKAVAARQLTDDEQQVVLTLLEMQRHAMFMYTSCGWFFDEISGIETVQIIAYAARVIQLAETLFATEIEASFLDKLAQAKSNIKKYHNGKYIYNHLVKPSMVDWNRIAADYAISSLFEKEHTSQTKLYCYRVNDYDYQPMSYGITKLLVGNSQFYADMTTQTTHLEYVSIHLGEQHMLAGVRPFQNEDTYTSMKQAFTEMFERGDIATVTQMFNQYFENIIYTLRNLFRDQQRLILNHALKEPIKEIVNNFSNTYKRHASLIRSIEALGIPLPDTLQIIAHYMLNAELKEALGKNIIKEKHIEKLLREASAGHVQLDETALAYALQKTLEHLTEKVANHLDSNQEIADLISAMHIANLIPRKPNLYKVQNQFYQLLTTSYPQMKQQAESGNESAILWVKQFLKLGELLYVVT